MAGLPDGLYESILDEDLLETFSGFDRSYARSLGRLKPMKNPPATLRF
jgi:hypothetical protein